MKSESSTIIIVAIFAIAIVSICLLFLRYRSQVRHFEQIARDNLALQNFCIEQNESLTAFIEDPSISAVELKDRADRILRDIESRNVNGNLDALIADNRSYVTEILAKKLG